MEISRVGLGFTYIFAPSVFGSYNRYSFDS
jgi:hypothetical protein